MSSLGRLICRESAGGALQGLDNLDPPLINSPGSGRQTSGTLPEVVAGPGFLHSLQSCQCSLYKVCNCKEFYRRKSLKRGRSQWTIQVQFWYNYEQMFAIQLNE